MESKINFSELAEILRKFSLERDWDQFHSPKNLAIALSIEASELLELFQWMKEDESRNVMEDKSKAQKVKDEIADVFYFLVRLSDILDVDLETSLREKMVRNAKKYPVELAKGNSKKYSEFSE